MKKVYLLIIASFFSVFMSAQVTYYVDGSLGDDATADGSEIAPYALLSTALKAVRDFTNTTSETEITLEVKGDILETKQCVDWWNNANDVTLTIRGEGAGLTKIMRTTDSIYAEAMDTLSDITNNFGRFFYRPRNNGAGSLDLIIEDITLTNFGFMDGSNSGALFDFGDYSCNVVVRRCNITKGVARQGLVVSSTFRKVNPDTIAFEDCYFSDLITIEANGNYPTKGLVYVLGTVSTNITNCVFSHCPVAYFNRSSAAKLPLLPFTGSVATFVSQDTKNGLTIVPTHKFVNNTIVDCGFEDYSAGAFVPADTLSVVYVSTHAGYDKDITTIVANNIILSNSSSFDYLDVRLHHQIDGSITSSGSTSNLMNVASVDVDTLINYIDADYTYTSSEVDFTMDGLVPELDSTSMGVYYLKAAGSKVFQMGDATNAPLTDIAGTIRATSPCLGAYEASAGTATKIEAATLENSFTVYPNPASDYIIIGGASEIFNVSIYKISGQEVIKTSVAVGASLDISALNSGMYYIRISDSETTINKSLIVK